MSWFSTLVDPGKIGGWVRAAVASLLTMIVAKLALKLPFIAQFVTPDIVDGIAVAAGTLVAGWLSSKSKA